LAPFVSKRVLFHGDGKLDELLDKAGLDFGTLLELQDLGVMTAETALMKDWSISPESPSSFDFRNKVLLVRSPEVRRLLRLPAYTLTKVGDQVMSLGKFQANSEFVLAVGQVILARGFEVSIGDSVKVSDDQFQIINAQPLLRT
jgi:hypothetical protein